MNNLLIEKMIINYIYNEKGIAEYVIIPTDIWDSVQEYLKTKKIEIHTQNKNLQKRFNPKDYYGITSHLNIDIEQELKNMREEWTRNF